MRSTDEAPLSVAAAMLARLAGGIYPAEVVSDKAGEAFSDDRESDAAAAAVTTEIDETGSVGGGATPVLGLGDCSVELE